MNLKAHSSEIQAVLHRAIDLAYFYITLGTLDYKALTEEVVVDVKTPFTIKWVSSFRKFLYWRGTAGLGQGQTAKEMTAMVDWDRINESDYCYYFIAFLDAKDFILPFLWGYYHTHICTYSRRNSYILLEYVENQGNSMEFIGFLIQPRRGTL